MTTFDPMAIGSPLDYRLIFFFDHEVKRLLIYDRYDKGNDDDYLISIGTSFDDDLNYCIKEFINVVEFNELTFWLDRNTSKLLKLFDYLYDNEDNPNIDTMIDEKVKELFTTL